MNVCVFVCVCDVRQNRPRYTFFKSRTKMKFYIKDNIKYK